MHTLYRAGLQEEEENGTKWVEATPRAPRDPVPGPGTWCVGLECTPARRQPPSPITSRQPYGISPGAQRMHDHVQLAPPLEQVGQPYNGGRIARICPGEGPVQVAPLLEQVDQPHGGHGVAGISPGAQLVRVAPLLEQVGRPNGGIHA